MRLSVGYVAHPVKIARGQQARIDDMLLAPEFEGQVEKHFGMLLVDFAGHIGDAFIDHVERLSPVAMVVALGPAARRLTVGIEDGGQVELDVSQVEAVDGVDDAGGGGLPVAACHAHDRLGARGRNGDLGLPFLVERRPLGMIAIDLGGGSDGCNGNPQAQPHAVRFHGILNRLQPAGKRGQVHRVLAVVLLPAVVDGEDIEAHGAGGFDQLKHRIVIDAALEGLPGVVNPGRTLRVDAPLQHLRRIGRQQPMRVVEAVAVAKGHQRYAGGGEFFAGGKSALEGHEIGIVEDADTHAVRIVPTGNFGALHGARNFAENGHAHAGEAIGYQQSRIFQAPGVENLAGNGSILSE